MSVKSQIVDARLGHGCGAAVTCRGQLVTAPLGFNKTFYQSLATPSDVYNFISPVAGKQFIIDGIIFSSNKNVSSTNGAVISIYEAASPTSNVPLKTLFTLDIGRLEKGSVTALNVLTSDGVWINGSADDATTNVTILGYYVDKD